MQLLRLGDCREQNHLCRDDPHCTAKITQVTVNKTEASHDQAEEDLVFVEALKAAVLLLTNALRSAPAPAPVSLSAASLLEPAAAAANESGGAAVTEGNLPPRTG